MNIGIYQTVNAHAPAIHWWLAHDKRFGPQLYHGKNPIHNGDNIGSIVDEIRRNPESVNNPEAGEFDHIMDSNLYNIHQESLREMENKEEENGRVDCTSAYFDANKGLWGNGEDPIVGYEYPIWSNYFGATKNRVAPACDKLIFAKSTTEQSAMFYITQYAYNRISEKEINEHSLIWWEDHMLMGGNDIGRWKEVWYKDYHNQCIADFHSGKLQYMWQLNFAHWDLLYALIEGSDSRRGGYAEGKFTLDYSHERLFKEKHDPCDIDDGQQPTIDTMRKNNVDHLLIDSEWFNHQVDIFDYLGVKNSDILIETASLYSKRYYDVVEAYEELRNKYYV
tara:strand:+ start:372 stop:1379 length:1008 start_codon:yes stop_codon:yes gene_type:complete